MGVNVTVTGLNERGEAISALLREFKSEVRKELINTGAMMTTDARRDHRFITRSGNLERSINADVPQGEMKMTFGLVNDLTTANWQRNPKATYGTFQHEGTGTGYVRSKAAEQHTPFLQNGGIKADHFIVRAWDKHIGGLIERVKQKVVSMCKKAVENGLF